MKKIKFKSFKAIATSLALALSNPAQADLFGNSGGGIPQIPAFLPMSSQVAETETLPIDGEWMVDTIRKRIRIEAGRAYAIDPWLHLFVLKIEPYMVVQQDIRRTGSGQYTGYDLPLMGNFTATLQTNGTLSVSVAGALGPVKYNLLPLSQNDRDSYDKEKSGQYAGSPPPSYDDPDPGYNDTPPPPSSDGSGRSLADCNQLDVDRTTGKIVCLD